MTANQKFSRFIGIDVSKAKLDIYDDATGEFLTVENTAKAIEKYVSALSPDPELLIVVDLTGGYEALCVNTFYNRGFTVHRAEGRRVKAFMRSYGEHAKTDRIDAYALALFGRKLHETLRMYTPLPLNLKPVTERISDLKTMLLQEKNRSTAPSLPPDMKKEIVRHIAYLEKEIERLYQKCLDIIKNDPPLAEAFYKIIAIKGIAEKSAVLLLTTLPELGCANRRQIAAIAGVAPYAKDSGTLYKAHVMRVLWQYGLADGMYNSVYRSLFALRPVRGKILHTPRYEPVDAVLDLIRACRGVAVLAHPSVYHSMELARELTAAGRLDGVEVYHPRNTKEDQDELLALAKQHDLIVTGGSDYHGMNTNTPRPVGACVTEETQIRRIEALAKRRKAGKA